MIKNDKKYSLNRMNSNSIRNLLGMELHHTKNSQIGVYDFTVQGGAIGDIQLQNSDQTAPITIPAGAIIRNVLIHVPVAVTSGGSATLAFTAASAGDLKAATAKTTFSLAAFVAGVPINTAATAIVPLVADTIPVMTVAVAALTAGKVLVYIDYSLSTF